MIEVEISRQVYFFIRSIDSCTFISAFERGNIQLFCMNCSYWIPSSACSYTHTHLRCRIDSNSWLIAPMNLTLCFLARFPWVRFHDNLNKQKSSGCTANESNTFYEWGEPHAMLSWMQSIWNSVIKWFQSHLFMCTDSIRLNYFGNLMNRNVLFLVLFSRPIVATHFILHCSFPFCFPRKRTKKSLVIDNASDSGSRKLI